MLWSISSGRAHRRAAHVGRWADGWWGRLSHSPRAHLWIGRQTSMGRGVARLCLLLWWPRRVECRPTRLRGQRNLGGVMTRLRCALIYPPALVVCSSRTGYALLAMKKKNTVDKRSRPTVIDSHIWTVAKNSLVL